MRFQRRFSSSWRDHIPKIMDSKSTIKFHKQPVPMEYKRDAWRRGIDIYSGQKASDDEEYSCRENANSQISDIYLLAPPPPSSTGSTRSSSALYLTMGLVVGGFIYYVDSWSERREGLVQSAVQSLSMVSESVTSEVAGLYHRYLEPLSSMIAKERMLADPVQIARQTRKEEYMTEDADDWISLYNMAKDGAVAETAINNNLDQKEEETYSPSIPLIASSSSSIVIGNWLKSGLPVLYWQTPDPIPVLHLSAMIQENVYQRSSAAQTTMPKKPLVVHCSANETSPSFSVNRIVRGWLKLEDETGEQDRILLDDRFPEGWKTCLARALEKNSPQSGTYYFVVDLAADESRGPVDERRMELFDHFYDLITMLQEKQCKLIIISHQKGNNSGLGNFLSLDSGRRVYVS